MPHTPSVEEVIKKHLEEFDEYFSLNDGVEKKDYEEVNGVLKEFIKKALTEVATAARREAEDGILRKMITMIEVSLTVPTEGNSKSMAYQDALTDFRDYLLKLSTPQI